MVRPTPPASWIWVSAIFLACASMALANDREPAALPTTIYDVDGISSKVEIRVDRWGVPHIRADQLYDVFFGQGFNAARDRLWQLDLWKRRGDGTLSEVFGKRFVDKDRAARLFLFRGNMRAEWLAYSSDTKRIASAFVAGINAYIELTRRDPGLLPFGFALLDYAPQLWTPETVVRIRSHSLLYNAASEVSRARFMAAHGSDALRFREWLEPNHELRVPEGLAPSEIPADALDVYALAKGRVSFERSPSGELVLADLARSEALMRRGSNNWAVAPGRTAAGRALLANDPHRALAVPSLRYIVHLSAPGLDAIGAGEPALPGISIGHNGQIAFGLTIFFIDQEDLYVYRTRPANPDEYWYQDRWEPMRVVTEHLEVRGEGPTEVRLKFTRHGPVIQEDSNRHTAISVRAAWLEVGMAPYLAGLELMRARNWDEFLAAMNRWGLPPENLVYADVDGHIGWKPGGLAPVRPNWDGLLPVPGDGRYEWAGFRDAEEFPVESDPERGWVATANQMNLPVGYPHALGFEWILPYRYSRIREVLRGERKATVASMLALQTDYHSMTARRVVALLAELTSSDPATQRGLQMLRAWDAVLDPTSAAAALYEVWFRRHLAPALLAHHVADEATRASLLDANELFDVFEGGNVEAWVSLLEHPTSWQGRNPRADRDRIVLTSLGAAVHETERLLGEEKLWRWGRLHQARLVHPLSPLLGERERARFDVGPSPRGGSGDTVNSTGYALENFVQLYGASFRMVLDVGNWDASVAMNSPGQSGDPASPHYRDLFEPWSRDEVFPLVYSRERVEAEAEELIVLRPEGRDR